MATTKGCERGQSTVELAIVLPILVVLGLCFVDLGRAFSAQMALANAAREGARYCALHPGDSSGTQARVLAELGTDGPALSATVAVTCPTVASGSPVNVALESPFTLVTPVVNTALGNTLTLHATAQMVAG